ncbi:MAG: putative glycoside hydrolase [Terriglobia bacterium]
MFATSRRSFLSNPSLAVLAIIILGGTPFAVGAPGQAQAKTQLANADPVSPPVRLVVASKNIPQKSKEKEKFPPPGPLEGTTKTELHTVAKGESLPSLALHYLPQTCFMTRGELEAAIQQANAGKIGKYLKPGTELTIPGIFAAPLVEHSVPVPRDFETRGIYLTGYMAGSDKGLDLIRRWREAGGNTVVFDVKDFDGLVNVPFEDPLAPQGKHVPIRNLPKLIRYIHSMGLHAIVRIAVFRDECLVQSHNELAVQSRRTGHAWRENGKLVWTDPSQPKVQEYDLALARMAANSGADEIQFDYVRFPAEGDQKDCRFAFQASHPDWARTDVIAKFVARAYSELHPLGVLLSLDVFGVMAWQRNVDLEHTGQDIPAMAKSCDVLSPMIYPSHFFGMDGYAHPGDAPEHFISGSMQRFTEITADSKVVLRPWLQAFAWHTKTFSDAYMRTQVSLAKGQGGIGFLFWNARNDYTKLFPAMAVMRVAPGRFFRGDEIRASRPKVTASVAP